MNQGGLSRRGSGVIADVGEHVRRMKKHPPSPQSGPNGAPHSVIFGRSRPGWKTRTPREHMYARQMVDDGSRDGNIAEIRALRAASPLAYRFV